MVVRVVAQSVADGQRLGLREHGRAGVALFLRRVEIAVIAVQIEHGLLRLELRLLQTDDVRVLLRAVVQKALAEAGAQTVDIPGYQFHYR